MSYMTIKGLWPGERHEDLRELRNSHGAAPVIWDALYGRYVRAAAPGGWLFFPDPLWALAKRLDIPLHHRAVLVMTFDRAYIERANYARAAADIRAFLADFPVSAARVNHWPEIADFLESDPDVPAIGFRQTSVADDPFAGAWDEETETEGPTPWDECFEVYRALEQVPCTP